MKNIWTFVALCLLPWILSGAPVPYAGKVAINGVNFQGDAQFTFTLRDANGVVRWRNGVDADSFINVPVDRGGYVVLLGGQGMNPLPANLFLEHPELYLQVRFFRLDTGQWLHMQPDQRITSAPHALSADVANLAKAVAPGAITRDMLAPDVLSDLNVTVHLPEQNATIQTGSITRDMLAPGVLSDLNATIAPGSITRQMLSEVVLADLNRTITITRSMLPASVQTDLNRTITRNMLPASVLADLNRTITRGDLPLDVLADLNRTITRYDLPASVRADLNRTITKSNLGSDVLDDLNASVTLDKLSPEVLAALQILPSVSTQPFARYDRNTGSAQIEVTGRGHNLSYQWLKNGQPVNGATAPVLQIAGADLDDNATYAVRITNSLGEATSQAVTLQNAVGAPGPPLAEANATEVPRAGLVLWFDAKDVDADGIADNLPDGTQIQTWVDKSGNDRNATQDSLVNRPYVDDFFGNDNPTLRFAGSQLLVIPDANMSVAEFYMVFSASAVNQEYMNLLAEGSRRLRIRGNTVIQYSLGRNPTLNGTDRNGLEAYDQIHVLKLFPTNTSNTYFEDMIFGALQSTGGDFLSGSISEVILYDRRLDDNESANLINHLKSKWSIQPSSEPNSADDLFLHWKFEPETDSYYAIFDHSGNARGASVTMDADRFVDGVDGKAFHFDGANDSLYGLPSLNSSSTLSMWLNPELDPNTGLPPDMAILSLGSHSGARRISWGGAEGALLTAYENAANYQKVLAANAVGFKPGWNHLVVVIPDGQTFADVYFNGVKQPTNKEGDGFMHFNCGYAFVGRHDLHPYYHGAMDEVRLYTRALSEAEIQSLYNAVQTPIVRTDGEHNATVGSAFSLSLAADNTPTTYLAEGLPAGLSLNVVTGQISGTLSQPGYHRVFVKAMNEHGTGSDVIAIVARAATDALGWPVDVLDGSDIPRNGMVLWLDANDVDADGVFDSGTDYLKLANWADKAGHDNNASQAVVGHQPTIRLGQLSERPALNLILFDGNQSLAFPAISDCRTLFWVMKRNSSGDQYEQTQFFSEQGTSTWGNLQYGKYFSGASPSIRNGVGRKNGEEFVFNANQAFGLDFHTFTLRTTATVPADLICKRGTSENYFTGNIGEMLIYDRALTDFEIRLVEQYLGQKWGIVLNQEPEVEAEAGLTGYWNFDEDEGTVVHDLSGNDNDGELYDTTESDVWQDGILGAGIRLDGINDRFSFPDHGGERKTFSLWFDPGFALEDNGTAVRLLSGNGGARSIWLNDFNSSISGEILGFRNHNTGEMTYVTAANANFSDGWNHLALVWDGGLTRYRVYVNGVVVDVNASAQGHFNFWGAQNNTQFGFPPTANGDVRYAGKIDEIRLYERSLSSAEILEQYQYPTSDADADGLSLGQEWSLGTDADAADSDVDGYTDGLEAAQGTDPLDANAKPATPAEDIGLVLHWKLDEANGTTMAVDSSNYSNGGALQGFSQSPWVHGRIGGAIRFDDDTSQKLNVSSTVSMNLPLEHTFAFWARADEPKTSGNFTFVEKTVSYNFKLNATNRLQHWVNQPFSGNYGNGSFLSDSRWHHYASVALRSKIFRLYRDGVKIVDEVGDYNAPPINTHASNFGGEAALDLDELRIYDRALTAAEVQALYDAAPPIPEQVAGLALWLDANDVDGDGEADSLADGASVSLWADKSGNDRDANQSDPNATFTYHAGTAEIMPGLVLDGSNDYMEIFDANVSAEYIFAVAMLKQEASIYAPVISRNIENKVMVRRDTDETMRSPFGNTSGGEFSYPSGLYLVDGNATGNFAYDELHTLVVGKGANTEGDGLYPGVMFGKEPNTTRFWKGEFAEILIYDRALSTEEIDWIQGYLGEKWGVTIQSE